MHGFTHRTTPSQRGRRSVRRWSCRRKPVNARRVTFSPCRVHAEHTMESEVHITFGLLAPPRRRRDAGAPVKGSAAAAAWQKKQHEVLQFRHNRYTPHKIQLDSQHCTRLPRDYLAERSSTGMRLRGGEACRRRCAPFAPPLVKHLSPVGQPRQVNAAGMGRVHDKLWGGVRKGRGLAACLDACSDKEHAREHGLEADPLPFSFKFPKK